jgi:transcriptional regulator CtsR
MAQLKFSVTNWQINLIVFHQRFTNVQGYFVESRRGGGGHIRIKRVDTSQKGSYIMHIISSMGDTISQQSAEIFINNFVDYEIISYKEAMLIKAAISDKVLQYISQESRDTLRALIFKNMIASIFS